MPRSGAVVMSHEDASNSFLTTIMTNMDEVQIKLKSRSLPIINWTPLFTDHASSIRFRNGRFYLIIQSRVFFELNGEETSCEGSIPISGQIRPMPGQLEINWKTEGASTLICTEELLPELLDEI
jgi:hypothetical protein